MRIYLFNIIIVFLFILSTKSPSIQAAEVLLGRVVSLDRPSGEMQLTLDLSQPDNVGEVDGKTGAKVITVKYSEDLSSSWSLGSLKDGDIIRVWGNFAVDNKEDFFAASRIMSDSSRGRRSDPTGVRSRLGKWRKGGGHSRGSGGGGNH